MKQLDTRWLYWSRYDPSRRQDEHGFFLASEDGSPGVLVDPVSFAEGDETHLAELGGAAAVVVTGPGRLETARSLAAQLGVPLHVSFEELGDVRVYGDEETLPSGLFSVLVPTSGSGTFAALVHEETRTVLAGELVTGGPSGALELEATLVSEGEAVAVARRLRGVLARYVRRVLVARGTPVLKEGERALQDLAYRYDPTAFLLRGAELRWDPPEHGEPFLLGSRFGVRFAECATLMGLKTLEFDIAEVPPGKVSVQLHRHDGEEECFVILSGKGEVLTTTAPLAGHQPHLPTMATPIEAGDMLGFPPRYQVAHAIRNTGDAPLRYLAFGAPSETLDMVDYSETGVRMERTPYGKRARFILPDERAIPYWDGVRTDA